MQTVVVGDMTSWIGGMFDVEHMNDDSTFIKRLAWWCGFDEGEDGVELQFWGST